MADEYEVGVCVAVNQSVSATAWSNCYARAYARLVCNCAIWICICASVLCYCTALCCALL